MEYLLVGVLGIYLFAVVSAYLLKLLGSLIVSVLSVLSNLFKFIWVMVKWLVKVVVWFIIKVVVGSVVWLCTDLGGIIKRFLGFIFLVMMTSVICSVFPSFWLSKLVFAVVVVSILFVVLGLVVRSALKIVIPELFATTDDGNVIK